MLEALTIIAEQRDKFATIVAELETRMDNEVFADNGDLTICERILQDHKVYLSSLNGKYKLVSELIAKKAH